MFGPITRTLFVRAASTSSCCNATSPISANPDGMRMAAGTPFWPSSAMVDATNLAGMANTATSTSPGMSSTLG